MKVDKKMLAAAAKRRLKQREYESDVEDRIEGRGVRDKRASPIAARNVQESLDEAAKGTKRRAGEEREAWNDLGEYPKRLEENKDLHQGEVFRTAILGVLGGIGGRTPKREAEHEAYMDMKDKEFTARHKARDERATEQYKDDSDYVMRNVPEYEGRYERQTKMGPRPVSIQELRKMLDLPE